MNDDDLVQRIRELGTDLPALEIDREAVLRAGRRRRRWRAGAATTGAAVLCTGLVVGALAWAGPAPDGPSPRPASSPSSSPAPSGSLTRDDGPHAVVDHVAGTIRLPTDDWSPTPDQQAVIDTAREYLEIRCYAEAGYDDEVEFVGPVTRYPGGPGRYRALGLWSDADLAASYSDVIDRGAFWWGFEGVSGSPNDTDPGAAPDGDLIACTEGAEHRLTGLTRQELDDAAWSAGTGGRPEFAADLTMYDDESLAALPRAERRAGRAAKEIVDEWRRCLAGAGYAAPEDTDALVPSGVLDLTVEYTPEQQAILDDLEENSVRTEHGLVEPDPATLGYAPEDLDFMYADRPRPTRLLSPQEERRVVEADVRCKRELDVVQRLADVDAAVLEKYVADNPDYFRSLRDVTSTMLANAVDVLDEAGVDVPDVGEVGAG